MVIQRMKQAKSSKSSSKSSWDIGIGENARKSLAQRLSTLLSQTYFVYLQTQNVHWNVRGPLFKSIHDLTEMQYTELAAAVDVIAERIRALGHPAPASMKDFQAMAKLTEINPEASEEDMTASLSGLNRELIKTLRTVAEEAGEHGDQATEDLCVQRLHVHEKNVWMLNSMVS